MDDTTMTPGQDDQQAAPAPAEETTAAPEATPSEAAPAEETAAPTEGGEQNA